MEECCICSTSGFNLKLCKSCGSAFCDQHAEDELHDEVCIDCKYWEELRKETAEEMGISEEEVEGLISENT